MIKQFIADNDPPIKASPGTYRLYGYSTCILDVDAAERMLHAAGIIEKHLVEEAIQLWHKVVNALPTWDK